MSHRTIRCVDLCCAVWNLTQCINATQGAELQRWTKKRDDKLAALNRTLDALNEAERDLMRRRYKTVPKELSEIGVSRDWLPIRSNAQ